MPMLDMRPDYGTKNLKTDIVFKLKPMEGKKPTSASGLVDNRLFTGENNLHAVMDTQYSLWYLKYDNGAVPPPLQQRFTSFSKLLNFVTDYYSKRNIEITEVHD